MAFTGEQSIYNYWKSGQADQAIKLNIIKPKIIEYCEIYDHYIKLRAASYNYTQAVEETAEALSKTEITVKRAIALVI